MRYLITGGAGFIGSHLADALLERGDQVVLLDDLSTGRTSNIAHLMDDDRVTVHRGTVLDPVLVRKLVGDADVVAHLAASVGVQLIVQRPLEAMMNNIRGTEVVLDACAEMGRRVLVASTSEIYGKNGHGPVREDADRVLGPTFVARWSYSTSKAVDEILAFEYWRQRAMPSIVVRLFNTSGPRQTGAYGMVVPRFVRQAVRGEPLTVIGDGQQQRCFCHVLDTVDGLLALLDEPRSVGDVFNVGSQEEVTIEQLARTVLSVTGSRSEIRFVPEELVYGEGYADMRRRIPDTTKINRLTGWAPTRSLERIIEDILEHERAPLLGG